MKHYTAAQMAYISDNYLAMPYWKLGKKIGRSMPCIAEKIKRMKLPSKIAVIMGRKKPSTYRAYSSWYCMKTRCTNPNAKSWENYGGRGIKVCERWGDFPNFLADMGERPVGYSIDRIDVNGNYERENCRWIPITEQSKTTRRYGAVPMCLDCGERRGNRKGLCHRCNERVRRKKKRETCHRWIEEHKDQARELGWLAY